MNNYEYPMQLSLQMTCAEYADDKYVLVFDLVRAL
jgi:hypothetical protein